MHALIINTPRVKHCEACTHPSMYLSIFHMYAHSCTKVILVEDGKDRHPSSRLWPPNRQDVKRRDAERLRKDSEQLEQLGWIEDRDEDICSSRKRKKLERKLEIKAREKMNKLEEEARAKRWDGESSTFSSNEEDLSENYDDSTCPEGPPAPIIIKTPE